MDETSKKGPSVRKKVKKWPKKSVSKSKKGKTETWEEFKARKSKERKVRLYISD